MYINKDTRYTNWFAKCNSVVVIVFFVWVLVAYLSLVGSVDNCCNVIYEKQDNRTDTLYKVEKPSGVESFIDFPSDTALLFPLELFAIDLTCKDLNITLIAYHREPNGKVT